MQKWQIEMTLGFAVVLKGEPTSMSNTKTKQTLGSNSATSQNLSQHIGIKDSRWLSSEQQQQLTTREITMRVCPWSGSTWTIPSMCSTLADHWSDSMQVSTCSSLACTTETTSSKAEGGFFLFFLSDIASITNSFATQACKSDLVKWAGFVKRYNQDPVSKSKRWVAVPVSTDQWPWEERVSEMCYQGAHLNLYQAVHLSNNIHNRVPAMAMQGRHHLTPLSSLRYSIVKM